MTEPKPSDDKDRPASEGWTAKSRLWADNVLVDDNATQAAIDAGYSENAASSIGYENRNKPHIAAYLRNERLKVQNKLNITAERITAELAKIAFYDARKLFDDDGKPIHISKLDDDTAGAISGVDICMVGNENVGFAEVMKIKVSDKKAALDMLGKDRGMFVDKLEFKDITPTVLKDDIPDDD
ncbi:MAG: hypothetical protein COB09_18950 [Thalassobium sp.]|nr:MAG: hypothetical protein COB09_18950 [Thalassobium sp.]